MVVFSLVIMVEVDSSFLSIKTSSQTVQASSKPYEFPDVDCDLYADGSYIYITPLENLKRSEL